jgi:hypothetical protein
MTVSGAPERHNQAFDTEYHHLEHHRDLEAAVNDLGAPAEPDLAGVPRVYKFDFAFDTPDLNDGIAVYTPAVGDVLLDLWVHIDEVFDGTTPFGDFGVDIAGDSAYLKNMWGASYLLDLAGSAPYEYAGMDALHENASMSSAAFAYNAANVGDKWSAPVRFNSTDPLLFVVSQDGTAGGTAVGGTSGTGTLYLVIASPASLNE